MTDMWDVVVLYGPQTVLSQGTCCWKTDYPGFVAFLCPLPSPVGAGLKASPGIRASRLPAFPAIGEASPAAVVGS